ncbi:MAG TPA: HDOD domain-containing protein [Bacteroidota bacterium]|nr:HDOD domain-containing protein [Bacteroidota bacterium]
MEQKEQNDSLQHSMENTQYPLVVALDVDDETLQLLRLEFVQRRARFSAFAQGADFQKFIVQRRIGVFIVELVVDSQSNVEWIKKMHVLFPDVAIIVISTYDERTKAIDIIGTGDAQFYLMKPCKQNEVGALAEQVIKRQMELQNQKLSQTLSTFKNLPIPQKFQNRLSYLLHKPAISLNEIIVEIEKNPGLVAKVLHIANSVHYWTRSPIVSLREAIIFIGIEYLETLVMAVDVFENMVNVAHRDIREHYETLWNGSLRRALVAKRIAENFDMVRDASAVHVAALLQDIGLLARLCLEPEKYSEMIHLAANDHISQYGAELRVFSTTHDELGSALLNRWNFPHEVIFAVANHHGESFGDQITQVVQIADALDPVGCIEPHDEALFPQIIEWGERFGEMLDSLKSQTVT